MPDDIIAGFRERAGKDPRRIVFAEGENESIIRASSEGIREGIFRPVLLGDSGKIREKASAIGAELGDAEIISPDMAPEAEEYSEMYGKRRGTGKNVARRLLRKNLFFGGMMIASGAAQGMVAGINNPTAAVLQAAGLTVGYEEGVSAPSSFFIMVLPEIEGREEKALVFADCAVNISPAPRQLAEIAVLAGRNAERFLGVEPRVALLSFSTMGSASHEEVDRVTEALKYAVEMAPDMAIEGEFQFDAALVREIAQRKVKSESRVAGSANVMIFPDLNAGNIAYKITRHLGKAKAYGPFLQGFARPVNDLSRGASAEEVLGVAAVTVVEAQETA